MSSFFYGNQFLILVYADGVIRLLDTLHHEPPYPVVTLQRGGSWIITCMKGFGSQVIFRLHFQLFLKRKFQLYNFAFRFYVGHSAEMLCIVGFIKLLRSYNFKFLLCETT